MREKGGSILGDQEDRRIDLMCLGVDSSLRCFELYRRADSNESVAASSVTWVPVWISLRVVFIYIKGRGESSVLLAWLVPYIYGRLFIVSTLRIDMVKQNDGNHH
jgi:hypothetical protein